MAQYWGVLLFGLYGLSLHHSHLFLINTLLSQVDNANEVKKHLIDSIPYFRYLMMGLGLLLVMRYRPKGLLPEKIIKN